MRSNLQDSLNLNSREKGSSSGNNISSFFEKSSSFNKDRLPSLPMGNSQEFSKLLGGEQNRVDNFISTLPNFEPQPSTMRVEGELMDDYWREDNGARNFQSMSMIDPTAHLHFSDPFKVSMNMGIG